MKNYLKALLILLAIHLGIPFIIGTILSLFIFGLIKAEFNIYTFIILICFSIPISEILIAIMANKVGLKNIPD